MAVNSPGAQSVRKTGPRLSSLGRTLERFSQTKGFRYWIWAGLLVLWEIWGRGQSPYFFTYPTAILRATVAMTASGELIKALGISLQALAVGFSLSALMAIPIGLLAGRFAYLRRLISPLMMGFYVTPRLALIPLIIIWVGIGFWAKIAVIWLISFFAIFFNVLHGVNSLSQSHLDVAKAYGANEFQILREVTLPAIMPFIATGMRLGLGLALIGMVVSEFLIGLTGLGGVIVYYSARLKVAQVFAAVLVILVLGLSLMSIAYALEARISHWKQTERAFK
jgi:NitT/TauT family transport system permease protein